MDSKAKHVYNLPYSIRRELCKILDADRSWEELGGVHIRCDADTLSLLGRAKSPTTELLIEFDKKNGLLRDLFIWLYRMNHLRAMLVLKPYVDESLHPLCGTENKDCEYSPYFSDGKTVPCSSPFQYSNGLESNHPKKLPVFSKFTNCKLPNSKQSLGNAEKPLSTYRTQENREILRRFPISEINTQDPHDISLGGRVTHLPSFTNIPYDEIRAATDNFNEKCILGNGGFGTVFKGKWKGISVAIKRLSPKKGDSQKKQLESLKQSLNELNILQCCRFDHILPLYAISLDGEDPCLIYQLMVNGSLEDRLLCKGNTPPLTWSQRSHIAECTAKGLNFLHTTYDKPLVHGDIKSANILLDKNMEAKIGDFGLSKLGPDWNNTHIDVTSVNGSMFYLPHEYLRGRQLSPKVDSYSYGIVMFELATGLRPYDPRRKNNKLLIHHIKVCEESQMLHTLLDCKAGKDNMKWFEGLIRIGQACTNEEKNKRPFMQEVLSKFESIRKEIFPYGTETLSKVKENLIEDVESNVISLENLKLNSPDNVVTDAVINNPNLENQSPCMEPTKLSVERKHINTSHPCALSESNRPNETMITNGTLYYQDKVSPGVPPVPKFSKLRLPASELRNPEAARNMKTSDSYTVSASSQLIINEEDFSCQEKVVVAPRIPPVPKLTELGLRVSELLKITETTQNKETSESCVLSESKSDEKVTDKRDPPSTESAYVIERVPLIPIIPEFCFKQLDIEENSGEPDSETSSSCSSEFDS